MWKRAKLVAKDSDPERTSKLARIRSVYEHLGPREALLFADELDLPLLPKVGAQWMPQATQVEVLTPGKNERRHLAGALDVRTGHVQYCLWFRKVTGLFLDLLSLLDRAYPAEGSRALVRAAPPFSTVVSAHLLSPRQSHRALLRRSA